MWQFLSGVQESSIQELHNSVLDCLNEIMRNMDKSMFNVAM